MASKSGGRSARRTWILTGIAMVLGASVAAPVAPAFASSFMAYAPEGLNVRSEPSELANPLYVFEYLDKFQMDCQLKVRTGNKTVIWDRVLLPDIPDLPFPQEAGWVLDEYVVPNGAGEFNGIVPRCDKPPTGAITNPPSGAEVKPDSKIVVTGRFEDDRGIESVEYFVTTDILSGAWSSIGFATKQADGSYTKQWQVPHPLGTRLTFSATITDIGGNVVAFTGRAVGVVVSDRDQPPQGVMTAPSAGTIAHYGRPLTLVATATDDDAVAAVTFSMREGMGEWSAVGTDSSGSSHSYSVKWTPKLADVDPGTVVAFKATATDTAGQQVEMLGPGTAVVQRKETKRWLTLRLVQFKGGIFGAAGRLTSGKDAACRKGMVVVIQRWSGREWTGAGRGVTTAAGTYKAKVAEDFAATFRAVTKEFPKRDGNICLAATSKKTHFG